jgi:hypothetical protein
MKLILLALLMVTGKLSAQISAEDGKSGRPFDYATVTGSPFLFSDWSEGWVKFANGNKLRHFKIKLDCAKNQLLLQYGGSTFAAESRISEFMIYRGKKDSLLFRKGFADPSGNGSEIFYQILAEGKAMLLKHNAKAILEQKLVNSTTSRRFEPEELYFIYLNGQLIPFQKRDPSSLDQLTSSSEPFAEFVRTSEPKLRDESEMQAVIKKFNEL